MSNSSSTLSTEKIAERARAIWESEGCPDGRATDHWLRAERELRETEAAATQMSTARARATPQTAARANGNSKGASRAGSAVPAN